MFFQMLCVVQPRVQIIKYVIIKVTAASSHI